MLTFRFVSEFRTATTNKKEAREIEVTPRLVATWAPKQEIAPALVCGSFEQLNFLTVVIHMTIVIASRVIYRKRVPISLQIQIKLYNSIRCPGELSSARPY